MAEEVLELSIEETNKLRAELGLKPLRVDSDGPAVSNNGCSASNVREGEEELLELSVDETNKLREKLGLPPLKGGTSKREVIFQQTENLGEKEEAAKRIERAKLQREVQEGVSQVFGSSTLASDEPEYGDAALSWAAKMRQRKAQVAAPEDSTKKGKKKQSRTSKLQESKKEYGADDLAGMQVRNSIAQLEAGGETVLTLADTSILETKTSVSSKVVGLNEEEDALENINMTELERQQDGLRKKRMLEMGMGRAGGYAGFDDEEFEELGGTMGPSRRDRGGALNSNDYETEEGGEHKRRGFRIGSDKDALADAALSDFDKVQQGKTVSLMGKVDTAASDYMTMEEAAEEELKRDVKFKKKKKKKDKKKRTRKTVVEEDEEENEEPAQSIPTLESRLLAQLEQNSPVEESSGLKKRRRSDDAQDDVSPDATSSSVHAGEAQKPLSKRAKYDEIMEKGNQRTKLAFGEQKQAPKIEEASFMDDEADDSFLNAALAKARRLNRLREMNKTAKGADAVVEAVKSMTVEVQNTDQSSGTMSFSVDDTREFSRALRARTEQKQREAKKQPEASNKLDTAQVKSESAEANKEKVEVEELEEDVDVDMEELAKEVKTDDIESGALEGSTAASKAGVGRGLSSFVSMLRTTGEIKGKHGGKEELRGRAKDERNYDIYEPLDLSKVVTIGKNATDKDREFANREIKLEYRDKHGRLLTQKDAYRELCYQFHGHGASKKKEEKRLKQIAREQAEARLASRQVSAARDGKTAATTLGALKATQKATGKAFIVHKT